MEPFRDQLGTEFDALQTPDDDLARFSTPIWVNRTFDLSPKGGV
jgi:hypothetical protein